MKSQCKGESQMQAIIMAAGKGSRLGNLTEGKPKSFAKIKGHRLIDYNISLLRYHGIDTIIVTGYNYQEFENEYESDQDIKLVFNPFYEEVNVQGSFWVGMRYITEEFLFIHADSLCDPDLFKELVESPGDIVLPVDFDTYNEEAMGVRLEDNYAVEISKDIPINKACGEFIGFAKFAGRVLNDIKEATEDYLKEKKFKEYFESSIQTLMDKRSYDIVILPTAGRFWAEIDFIEDFDRAVSEIPNSLVDIAQKDKSPM